MIIRKLHIENFKSFKGDFSIEFSDGLNILVGNNEVGKSTILEAIHLALSGFLNGHYLRNELSQYLFNNEIVQEYLLSLQKGTGVELPYILIELFFDGETTSEFAKLEGDANSNKSKATGISFKIEYDDNFSDEYEALINADNELKTLPIEFYKITWKSFARDSTITSRSIPIKSVLIDSSSNQYKNGSDIYISRIIKNNLDVKERAGISQAFRQVKEIFMSNPSIETINKQVKKQSNIPTNKNIEISVDLSTQNAWETILMTYLNDVPFHQIGKGEQCIIKTNLSLSHKKSEEANLILLEEPENHLTHTKLNEFLKSITDNCKEKQIIISTHSSFVANKLGLENLILLNSFKNKKEKFYIKDLETDTQDYFKKLSGYDTLRLILCKKAVLVEGDSDELIIQKAYKKERDKLPIENGIDIISVRSLAFPRFLDIADKLKLDVAVVTDTDGKIENVKNKYEKYLKDDYKDKVKIFFDEEIDSGELKIGEKDFNYNTLEPKILKANNLKLLNKIFETDFKNDDQMHKYMKRFKTECALKLFETKEEIVYPNYIENVISWCNEE